MFREIGALAKLVETKTTVYLLFSPLLENSLVCNSKSSVLLNSKSSPDARKPIFFLNLFTLFAFDLYRGF